MCLSILQEPHSDLIPARYFENGYRLNSHGCGFMFVADGEVIVRKAYWNWNDMYKKYRQDRKDHADSFFGIHFRLASAGSIDDDNCHPHIIHPGKWAMNHTGVLPLKDEPFRSDSAILAEMLSLFPEDELPDLENNDRIMKILGTYNTVVLMGIDTCTILNENHGHRKDGCWFSNRSYDRGK